MAQVHHASWHLLRTRKVKGRTRVYTRATHGVMRRKMEVIQLQMEANLLRAQQAEASVQALYAAMQDATIKAGA